MKPVQLMPAGVASVKESAPGSGSVIASILAGGIIVLGVGGYFMMAHVSTLNDQSAKLGAKAMERQNEATQISQQIADAGAKKDWSDTLIGFQTQINDKLAERTDFAVLAAELDNIRPPGTWLVSVTAAVPGSGASSGGSGVAIQGYAPTAAAVAALVTRINATESMDDARVSDVSYEKTVDRRIFVNFSITAVLADPADIAAGGSGIDGDATTVGDGSGQIGSGEISLEPEPGFARRAEAAAKAAQAAKAGKGGSGSGGSGDSGDGDAGGGGDDAAATAPEPAPKPKPQLTSMESLVKDTNAFGGSK